MMSAHVSAIVVVRRGGPSLDRVLSRLQDEAALSECIIVAVQPTARVRGQLAVARLGHVVDVERPLTFAEAVETGYRFVAPETSDADAVWLLSEDTVPEPGALSALTAALDTGRTTALTAPKLVAENAPDWLLSLGRSLTRFGRSVPVATSELDQAQFDGLTDVLGADLAGLLVRRSAWRALGGLDPALRIRDAGLDLGVRARLAGHHVQAVPEARVACSVNGIADVPDVSGSRSGRRYERAARREQLHRRLVYAPGWLAALHWLTLVPLAVIRSIVALLTKVPGTILGEFTAAFAVAWSFGGVSAARRNLNRVRSERWSVIAPLRIRSRELQQRRSVEAERRRNLVRGRAPELRLIGSGGGWVLLGTLVLGVVLGVHLLGATALTGGGTASLSDLGTLWRHAGAGWVDGAGGGIAPADPFTLVLAVLGSVTFWSPSFALVLLWFLAPAVAAVGVWWAVARWTEHGLVRAFAALAWALAPPFLIALYEGRPAAVIAHIALGWLACTMRSVGRSWTSAATASLLSLAVAACSPSLVPALVVAWIVAIVVNWRGWARVLVLPIPTLIVAAPLIIGQFRRGTFSGLLADPGLAQVVPVPGGWDIAVGLPVSGGGGWGSVLRVLGVGWSAPMVFGVLLLPLALLALGAVGRRLSAALALGAGLLGFVTALAVVRVSMVAVADQSVPIWAGTALSLWWLGLVLAASVTLDRVPARVPVALVAGGTTALAALPMVALFVLGHGAVRSSPGASLPALVQAAAAPNPRVSTLLLTPTDSGAVRARVVVGRGMTLDATATYPATATVLLPAAMGLTQEAGRLLTEPGFPASALAHDFGVSFVVVAPGGGTDLQNRIGAVLDANPGVVAAGSADAGRLWRFTDALSQAKPVPSDTFVGSVYTVAEFVVLAVFFLLALPLGASRESVRRGPGTRGFVPSPTLGLGVGPVSADPESAAEPELTYILEPEPAASGTSVESDPEVSVVETASGAPESDARADVVSADETPECEVEPSSDVAVGPLVPSGAGPVSESGLVSEFGPMSGAGPVSESGSVPGSDLPEVPRA